MFRSKNYLALTCPHFMADDGGDGGDGGGSGGSSDDGGSDTYTPPATQAEFDKAVEDRLARQRKQYGMTAAEAKDYKSRFEALENDLASETEKAVNSARDEATKNERAKGTERSVKAEFRAAAKGVLSGEQLDALIEDLDLSKYADDTGDPDIERIEAKVKKFAPNDDGKDKKKPPPRGLGQGDRPPAGAKPGDQGRAMAARRFKKQSAQQQ